MLAPSGTGAPEQEHHHWLFRGGDALTGYCQHGTDRLDGALVGQGWDGRTLALPGTGVSPLAPEQELHRWLLRGGALYKVVAGTNCIGAARTRIICVGETKKYK